MMCPAATKRGHVQAMLFQDGVHKRKVGNVILRFILLDCHDAAAFAESYDGPIKVSVIFFPEDPFEFLTVIAGAGLEIFIAVEDVEDLDLHAG